LAKIVLFLLRRIPPDKRVNAIRKLIIKFRTMSSEEIANKKMQPYSSMGQSISFIKNVLSGREKHYVRNVLDAISRHLVD
jgi:hypothetical protein